MIRNFGDLCLEEPKCLYGGERRACLTESVRTAINITELRRRRRRGILLTPDPERTASDDLLASWSAKKTFKIEVGTRAYLLTAKATCSKSRSTSAPPMRHFRGRCRSARHFRVSVLRSRRAGRRCVSVRRTRPDAHNVQVARCRPPVAVVLYASSCPGVKSSEIPSALRRAAAKESFWYVSGHRTCDTR